MHLLDKRSMKTLFVSLMINDNLTEPEPIIHHLYWSFIMVTGDREFGSTSEKNLKK